MLLFSCLVKLIYLFVNVYVNIIILVKIFKYFIFLKKKCNELWEKLMLFILIIVDVYWILISLNKF